MKKLLALLLAVMMALGCVSALAEEEAPALATNMNVKLNLDANFVTMYAAMMAQDETTAQAAAALVSILNKLDINVVDELDCGYLILGANGTTLATIGLTTDGEGLYAVSDLFPHYALHVTLEEIQALVEMAKQAAASNMPAQIGGVEISPEQIAEAVNGVTPYVEDLMGYIETVTEDAVIEETEEGEHMIFKLTTHHVADILNLLLTRLSTDEAMKPYAEIVLRQMVDLDALQKDVNWGIERGLVKAAEMAAAPAQEIVTVESWTTEDGSDTYIYDANALIKVSTGWTDLANATIVTAIAATEPVADIDAWEAKFNAIASGEDQASTMIEFSMLTASEYSTEDWSDPSFAMTMNMQCAFEVLAQGMHMSLTANVNSVHGVWDSANDVTEVTVGINPGLTGADLLTIKALVTSIEAPAAPSLEGLTVIDPLTMDEETSAAFSADVMNYGLATVLTAAQQALPEEFATIMQLAMPSEAEAAE